MNQINESLERRKLKMKQVLPDAEMNRMEYFLLPLQQISWLYVIFVYHTYSFLGVLRILNLNTCGIH